MSKNVEMLVYCKENIPKVSMSGLIDTNEEEAKNEADAKANPADESDDFYEAWFQIAWFPLLEWTKQTNKLVMCFFYFDNKWF